MKLNFPRIHTAAVASILALLLATSTTKGQGCFSIVVGRDASADGHVIMAHNEDDGPPQVVNHHKVSRMKHPPGIKVRLRDGGQLDEVEETWGYIWSEMPGMLFSDSYVNEWGVAIASDACPSREDRPELTEGGISYNLRRIVARRAKSAREGVLIAGELLERFGYNSSGRTYIICDPDEGWLFCAINGKHWLARRVPDDEVAMIANTFTVRGVDLTDRENFLASHNIIDYAITRGWYDPQGDQSFDFAAAYANPQAASDSGNFCRQWSGLRRVTEEPIPLQMKLPFSVKPEHKLDVADLMQILRDHYEGTELYQSSSQTGSPHENRIATICNRNTQTSFVVQLRGDMPPDIGIVYWVCLANPCTSVYIPFHFGIFHFPAGYSLNDGKPSSDLYRERVEAPFQSDPLRAFWTFSNFSHMVERDYDRTIARAIAELKEVQKRALTLQGPLEEAVYKLYPIDKATAMEMLANYSDGLYLNALEAMDRVLSEK